MYIMIQIRMTCIDGITVSHNSYLYFSGILLETNDDATGDTFGIGTSHICDVPIVLRAPSTKRSALNARETAFPFNI